MENTMPVKLVEVLRGELAESVHNGHIAVVSSDGTILHELGDSGRIAFFHSAAKPLQAVAVLEAGVAESFGLDLKEIAVMASSHSGTKEHIEVLKGIMSKLKVNEDMLQCGAQEPLDKEAARELYKEGLCPTRLHCNCSGKHLGFIAASLLKSLGVEDYHKFEHPFQAEIRKTLSLFGGLPESGIKSAVDSCGVPVYGMPLKNMARTYANLCSRGFSGGKYEGAQNYIISAMTMYPEMVAGKGRFDTEMMRNFGDRLIVKTGAEAVCCAGLPGKGIGVAVKIDDGNARAVEPVMLQTLMQMNVIGEDEARKVEQFLRPAVLSLRGEKIGEIRTVFRLQAKI